LSAGMINEQVPLCKGGKGSTAYAQAVGLYLSFGIDKCAGYWSSFSLWDVSRESMAQIFGRQAIPMTWSFAEANPFSKSTGCWKGLSMWVWKSLNKFPAEISGVAKQLDAHNQHLSDSKVISTDPPYYDNIGYADLSDFFYVWLRPLLKSVFPDLFNTLASPKSTELVATPYRHKSKKAAEIFFMDGMTEALECLANQSHPWYPLTVYYAYKQSETKGETGTASTGWETFLEATISAGFSITGTWPMRTELTNRLLARGTNALASSIILVCRLRSCNASTISRREMIKILRSELPQSLKLLQVGNTAPVDLAQAAIGPGMKIYTRYAWLYILQIINPIFILRLLMSVFDLQSMIISRSSLRYLD